MTDIPDAPILLSGSPDEAPGPTPFEAIRQEMPEGGEYWSARELARILGYATWDKFQRAIQKAEVACEVSGYAVADHFSHVGKMITLGKGAQRRIADVHLSRYACYLIVQNADPSKPIVALGQTYFAVQTRRAELADALEADALAGMSEDQKRLFVRRQLAEHNTQLAAAARRAGVVTSNDFAVFQDHGYMGLYAGEQAVDIQRRKGLTAGQRILDYMGSHELAANLFRASLTEQRLDREQVQGQPAANQAHYEVGRAVREFIAEQGGTMPEALPTPLESIPQLEARERRRLQQIQARQAQLDAGQQTLFDD